MTMNSCCHGSRGGPLRGDRRIDRGDEYAGGRAELAGVDGLSSELLGFTPDARVLIVNCDDLGIHEAINAAVVESIENGIASSCSLIVPFPAAADGAAQDGRDRRVRDADSESVQLILDAHVAPPRVLSRQPRDQTS